jgi:hypothetical protein
MKKFGLLFILSLLLILEGEGFAQEWSVDITSSSEYSYIKQIEMNGDDIVVVSRIQAGGVMRTGAHQIDIYDRVTGKKRSSQETPNLHFPVVFFNKFLLIEGKLHERKLGKAVVTLTRSPNSTYFVVTGDRIIAIENGKPVRGFNKKGKPVWSQPHHKKYMFNFATAPRSTRKGVLIWDRGGVFSISPKNGKQQWSYRIPKALLQTQLWISVLTSKKKDLLSVFSIDPKSRKANLFILEKGKIKKKKKFKDVLSGFQLVGDLQPENFVFERTNKAYAAFPCKKKDGKKTLVVLDLARLKEVRRIDYNSSSGITGAGFLKFYGRPDSRVVDLITGKLYPGQSDHSESYAVTGKHVVHWQGKKEKVTVYGPKEKGPTLKIPRVAHSARAGDSPRDSKRRFFHSKYIVVDRAGGGADDKIGTYYALFDVTTSKFLKIKEFKAGMIMMTQGYYLDSKQFIAVVRNLNPGQEKKQTFLFYKQLPDEK